MMADLSQTTLGPCRLLERISQSSKADVYKAYHTTMEKDVVVKVLLSTFTGAPELLSHFEREVNAAAKLQHLHILPLLEYGQEQDHIFLIMPYVETGSLKDLVGNEPLDLTTTVKIVRQIADALDFAHQTGVLHGHLKPANILLDPNQQVLVSDFGVMHLVETANSLKRSGVVDMPVYMSPEQGLGYGLEKQSDIYALGVMVYEMVTGVVPFQASTPIALVFKHVGEQPPAPRSINTNIPESVEQVILKALAKDLYSRFSTAVEMADALQEAIDDASVLAATPAIEPSAAPSMPEATDPVTLQATEIVQEADAAPKILTADDNLSEELVNALGSSLLGIRKGALTELITLFQGDDPILAAAARQMLNSLSHDTDPEIAGTAHEALLDVAPATAPEEFPGPQSLAVIDSTADQIIEPDQSTALEETAEFESAPHPITLEADVDMADTPADLPEVAAEVLTDGVTLTDSPSEASPAAVAPGTIEALDEAAPPPTTPETVKDVADTPDDPEVAAEVLTDGIALTDLPPEASPAVPASDTVTIPDEAAEAEIASPELAPEPVIITLTLPYSGLSKEEAVYLLRMAYIRFNSVEVLAQTLQSEDQREVRQARKVLRDLSRDECPEVADAALVALGKKPARTAPPRQPSLARSSPSPNAPPTRPPITATQTRATEAVSAPRIAAPTKSPPLEIATVAPPASSPATTMAVVEEPSAPRTTMPSPEPPPASALSPKQTPVQRPTSPPVPVAKASKPPTFSQRWWPVGASLLALMAFFGVQSQDFDDPEVWASALVFIALVAVALAVDQVTKRQWGRAALFAANAAAWLLGTAVLIGPELDLFYVDADLEDLAEQAGNFITYASPLVILLAVGEAIFGRRGQAAATRPNRRIIRVWDLIWLGPLLAAIIGVIILAIGGDEVAVIRPSSEAAIYGLAFDPRRSDTLISGGNDDIVWAWDIYENSWDMRMRGHTGDVNSVAYNEDGSLIASASDDGSILIHDGRSGNHLMTLEGHTNGVMAVAFQPNGRYVASGGWDDTVRLWDIRRDGREIAVLRGHEGNIRSVAFSPDGRLLATGSDDRTVRLWDVSSGNLMFVLRGHGDKIRSVAFSPDGQLLASGSEDSTIRLWDPQTGDPEGVLRGHDGRVHGVAFSPNGRLLASASSDRTVRIWRVSRQTTIEVFGDTPYHLVNFLVAKVTKDSNGYFYSVAFSANSDLLAAAGSEGVIRVWDVSGLR